MLTMSPDTLLTSLSPGGRAFERLCKWALEKFPSTDSGSRLLAGDPVVVAVEALTPSRVVSDMHCVSRNHKFLIELRLVER